MTFCVKPPTCFTFEIDPCSDMVSILTAYREKNVHFSNTCKVYKMLGLICTTRVQFREKTGNKMFYDVIFAAVFSSSGKTSLLCNDDLKWLLFKSNLWSFLQCIGMRWQRNSILRNMTWREPFECLYTPKSTAFQSCYSHGRSEVLTAASTKRLSSGL